MTTEKAAASSNCIGAGTMQLNVSIAIRKRTQVDAFGPNVFSMNPSIVRSDAGYICCVRGVNYDREAIWYSSDWQATNRKEPIRSRNVIVLLDRDLHALSQYDLDVSQITSDPRGRSDVQDIRLMAHCGDVLAIGTAVERDFEWSGHRWTGGLGMRRMFVATLQGTRLENPVIIDSPCGAAWEKNWVPVSQGQELALIANIHTGAKLIGSPIIGFQLKDQAASYAWTGGWSGSSPFVQFEQNYIGVLHRKDGFPEIYTHMFCLLDHNLRPMLRSVPFSFENKYIEFCCGITLNEAGDGVIIAYGVNDKAAVVVELGTSDVLRMLTIEVVRPSDLLQVKGNSSIAYEDLLKCVEGHTNTTRRVLRELNDCLSRVRRGHLPAKRPFSLTFLRDRLKW